MYSKAPKTSLAGMMREWMSVQTQPFTTPMICAALQLKKREERQRVFYAKRDFVDREEIVRVPDKRNRRQRIVYYRYNSEWRRKYALSARGGLLKKILKAMYVSGSFTVTDIIRLAEAPQRIYVDQVKRRLARAGHLQAVGRRRCSGSNSAETIFHIADRDKFRLEVMR